MPPAAASPDCTPPPSRRLARSASPAELKQALAAAGIASEFHAGALYCAGQVVIRRRAGGGGEDPGGGGLVVEGALSAEYYSIRDVVYEQMRCC